jgi:hypothetical protein
MAIPVIQTRSEQKEPANTTTTTITAPTGITDGDILIIVLATDGNSTAHSFPAGFSPLFGANGLKGPSNRCTLTAAWKRASGESGNYTVSWTSTEQAIAEMYRIDGATAGNVIQNPGESNSGTGSTATITPVAATDTNDSLVLVCFGMDDDDITVDSGGDADYTVEDIDESGTGGTSCSIGVQSKGIATAAVPPQCDLTLTASEEFAVGWFAVRSIAPTGAPPGLRTLATLGAGI